MTAAIAHPRSDAAEVTCARCGEWFELPRDRLHGRPFLCPKHAPPEPAPRPTRSSPRGLSKADAILLGMLREEESLGRVCDLTQTAVIKAAWAVDRFGFGLRGEADQHPCSNRVIVELVKLVRLGLVDRVGVCLYRLTEFGRKRVSALSANARTPRPRGGAA